MSDWHIRVLRAAARRARIRMADDAPHEGEDPVAASERAEKLARQSEQADTQLAAAETRRREGSAHHA
jgi:hypothetical protein